MAMPHNLRYKPLNSSSREVRLLQLLPFKKSREPQPPWYELANIQCKLVYKNLDTFPEYEALSYTWGSSGSDVNIEVDGQVIPIRANLAYALAALRGPTPRTLWVDALCIDQRNIEERNHQVGQMGEIYRRASQVLTWLGRPSESFGSVVESAVWLAERLGESSPASELPPAPEFDPEDEMPELYYSRVITDQREYLQLKWTECLDLKKRLKRRERYTANRRKKLEVELAEEERQDREEQRQWEEQKEQRAREQREALDSQPQEDLLELPELLERQEVPENQELENLDDLKRMEEQQLKAEKKAERLQKQTLREQRVEQHRQEIRLREQDLRHLLYTFEQSLKDEKLAMVQRQLIIRAEQQRVVEEWQKQKMAESLEWLEEVIDKATDWPRLRLIEPLEMVEKVVNRRLFRIRNSWSDHLLSLASICELPYWKRLWIVPEVLLAKKVVVCFGDDKRTTCDWDIWTNARQTLERIPCIWELPPIIARSITSIKQSLLFQLDKQRQYRNMGWPLHTLLLTTEKSLCEDPKDKIYGLLGLATDIRIEDLDINYKKSLYEVYQDAMRWYCNCHGGQKEGFPSLVRFSQIVQMSLKGNSTPLTSNLKPILAQPVVAPPHGRPEMFHTAAISMGGILPLEKLLDDHELTNLRQRDWLYTVTEYLHNSKGRKSKDALEDQLKYLDSISTTFTISNTTAAYAITEGDASEIGDRCISQPSPKRRRTTKEGTQFFMAAGGRFGLASSCIREDDILCQFKECDTGVILRRTRGHYILVSKAILFPGPTGASTEPESRPSISSDATVEQPSSDTTIIDVVLDTATLQDLTRPIELTKKHIYREPICIQESSFGWYQFLNNGHDVTVVEEFEESPIAQPNMIIQTRSLWKVLSSKWNIFWTQPLQRLWLLVTLFSYLSNALKGGRSALEMAAFGHLQALMAPLKYLSSSAPKRTLTVATRRRLVAMAA